MLLGHLVILMNGLLFDAFEGLELLLVEPIEALTVDREDVGEPAGHSVATGDHRIVEEQDTTAHGRVLGLEIRRFASLSAAMIATFCGAIAHFQARSG